MESQPICVILILHWRENPVPLVTTVRVIGLLPTKPVSTYTEINPIIRMLKELKMNPHTHYAGPCWCHKWTGFGYLRSQGTDHDYKDCHWLPAVPWPSCKSPVLTGRLLFNFILFIFKEHAVPSRDFSLLCAKSLFATPPPKKKVTKI